MGAEGLGLPQVSVVLEAVERVSEDLPQVALLLVLNIHVVHHLHQGEEVLEAQQAASAGVDLEDGLVESLLVEDPLI